MAQFIVNKSESFTLIASTDTGNTALILSDAAADALAKTGFETSDPAAYLEAVLDVMGADAMSYLEAMGALAGVGDAMADAFMKDGMSGLGDYISDLAASGAEAFMGDGFNKSPNDAHLPEGFDAMTGTELADMLGFGMPSGKDAPGGKDTSESDDAAAAIETMLASQSQLMDGDLDDVLDAAAEGAATGAAAGALGGAVVGSLVPEPVTTAGGAVFGALVVGFLGGLVSGASKAHDVIVEKLDSDDDSMPKGPESDDTLTREEFNALFKDKLDPLNPDPETTLPSDPDAEYTPKVVLNEDDLDDLDETTQPSPEDVDKGAVDLAKFDEGLDPWINPGSEPQDVIVFKAPMPAPGQPSGEDFFEAPTFEANVAQTGQGHFAAESFDTVAFDAPFVEADIFM